MNLIEEKKKLEHCIENRQLDYDKNVERINKAKQRIDEEAEIKKKNVDDRYELIQYVYQNQINQMKDNLNNIENEIRKKCEFDIMLIIDVISRILYDYTNMNFECTVEQLENKYLAYLNHDDNVIYINKEITSTNDLVSIYNLPIEGTSYITDYVKKVLLDISNIVMDNDKISLSEAYNIVNKKQERRVRK